MTDQEKIIDLQTEIVSLRNELSAYQNMASNGIFFTTEELQARDKKVYELGFFDAKGNTKDK